MSRKSRFLVALMVALAAVPTALGVAPLRSVVQPTEPILIPAGTGCAFDVLEELGENARLTFTAFSSGRLRTQAHGDVVLTNLENEQSIPWKNRWNATETFDPVANAIGFNASGRFLFSFFPGDQGPLGTVGDDGALYAFVGRVELTIEADNGAVTAFSVRGQALDVCAALST